MPLKAGILALLLNAVPGVEEMLGTVLGRYSYCGADVREMAIYATLEVSLGKEAAELAPKSVVKYRCLVQGLYKVHTKAWSGPHR